MTIKQLILGVAAAGATVVLMIHRMPEAKTSKTLKIAKLDTLFRPVAHPAPRKNRSNQPVKTERA